MAMQTMSGIPRVTSTANFYSNTNPLLQSRGIGGFAEPSALFGAGEQGAWWDFSDLDSMYQESGCLTKAALESAVGFVADKRVQTRGPEMNPDPNIQLANWVKTVSGAGSVNIAKGLITLDTYDGSNVGVVVGGVAPLDNTKYYEVTLDIAEYTSGLFGIYDDTSGTVVTNIPLSVGAGVQKFICKPLNNGKLGIKRSGAIPGHFSFKSFSIKEYIGNHLVQPTAGARPILSRRYNKCSNSETFNGANWSVFGAVTTGYNFAFGPYGRQTAVRIKSDVASNGLFHDAINLDLGPQVQKWWPKNNAGSNPVIILGLGQNAFGGAGGDRSFLFNTETGAISSVNAVYTSVTAVQSGNGFWEVSATFTPTVAANSALIAYASGAGCDFLLGCVDSRSAADFALAIPNYQRITTGSDYDTLGFPAYLLFDGATKWMQSASAVDLSGTNKLTVITGLSKLSDATLGIVLETASGGGAPFTFNAPIGAAIPQYNFDLRGTNSNRLNAGNYAAPITNVVSTVADKSSNATMAGQMSMLVNNVQPSAVYSYTGSGPVDVGNFTNEVLYLGSRQGTAAWFNGRMFGMVLRGASSNDNDLSMTNKWMGSKCGLFF